MPRLKLIFWPATKFGRVFLGAIFIGILIALARPDGPSTLTPAARVVVKLSTLFFGLAVIFLGRAALIFTNVILPKRPSEPPPRIRQILETEPIVTQFAGVSHAQRHLYLRFVPGVALLTLRTYRVTVTDRSYVFAMYNAFDPDPLEYVAFDRDAVGLPERRPRWLTVNLKFNLPTQEPLLIGISKLKAVGMMEKVDKLTGDKAA